jgi:hypothetical protein
MKIGLGRDDCPSRPCGGFSDRLSKINMDG